MKLLPLFHHTSNGVQLILFLCLVLLSTLVVMALSWMAASVVFDIPLQEIGSVMGDTLHPNNLDLSRFMQLGSQLGLFLLPPVIMAFLVSTKPFGWLGFGGRVSSAHWIAGISMLFVALPFLHWLAGINELIVLPEGLSGIEQWMRRQEDAAEVITQRFLDVDKFVWLLFNLIMIAVIPGIGEEMVFRSVLQPVFSKGFRNVHLGIFFTAVVFAAMHLQFYGFLPRLVLGMFMGYAFFLSGSIWLPVVMHTVNNGAAVLVHYLHFNGFSDVSLEDAASFSGSPFYVLLSAALTVLCLIVMVKAGHASKKEVRHSTEPPDQQF